MAAELFAFGQIAEAPTDAEESGQYLRGMQRLVRVVQELSLARSLEDVQRVVRSSARELTGADGATFVLRDGTQCFYCDEDAIQPLWKGKRFPMSICISGWVMLNKQPVVIEDIYEDERIPHDAYRPTFVKSLATVPIRTLEPIGAIGNYWAHHYRPRPYQLSLLQALADTTAVALENVRLYQDLEQRVVERTAALQAANEEVRRLSMTDELTGLNNLRGFIALAEQAMKTMRRLGEAPTLYFFDLDGLKRVNDDLGHEAGDRMISDFAALLRMVFRQSDIVGHLGGDEFCALTGGGDQAPSDRLQDAMAQFNARADAPYRLSASLGRVSMEAGEALSLDRLLANADAKMYEAKRARRQAGILAPR